MSDKIFITEDELKEPEHITPNDMPRKDRFVFCNLTETPAVEPEKEKIPIWVYGMFLIPLLGIFFFIWACVQKKFKLEYQMPSLIVCLLMSLFPFFLFACLHDNQSSGWKNELARKAKSGVVIVVSGDRKDDHDASAGSGVVIAKNKDTTLILTNRHVIEDKQKKNCKMITVLTSYGEKMEAKIAALPKDKEVDMAILCIQNCGDLEVLGRIADYSSIKPGDDVIAIGHPCGLSYTMTDGIVSALRDNMLIQSSADINPGNSGGPLLNRNGDIIGINTFYMSKSPGLNFAFRADFVYRKSLWDYSENISDLLNKKL